jgi:inorganic triphosphatase YgiF
MSSPPSTARVKTTIEPEIQYRVPRELLPQIEAWLMERGGQAKVVEDFTTYYDTKNYRLFREGIEYRGREQEDHSYRYDMKTPVDTKKDRIVVPDKDGILRRREMKFRTDSAQPSLGYFFGQTALKPVQSRVKKLFDKLLEPKFHTVFEKKKIDCFVSEDTGQGKIEYTLKKGHFENIARDRKSEEVCIVELEDKGASPEALLAAKAEIEAAFAEKGLERLEERTVMMGFAFVEEEMTEKAADRYHKALERQEEACMVMAA